MAQRARSSTKQSSARASAETDDLTAIKGVGPTAHRALDEAGIRTFAQLHDTPESELAGIVAGRSEEQIRKQDWRGQAAALVAAAEVAVEPEARRHSFTLKVEVEHGRVLWYRVTDVRSEATAAGSGWEPGEVIGFIESRLRAGASPTDAVEESPAPTTSADATTEGEGPAPWLYRFDLFGVAPSDAGTTAGEVEIELDRSKLGLPADATIDVDAVVFAKRAPIGRSIEVGRSRRTFAPAEPLSVHVAGDVPESLGSSATLSALVEIYVHDLAPEQTARGIDGGRALLVGR